MPKILIVEDNELNRDVLSRRLQRKGYDIVIAVDGHAGIESARQQRPDLILMDVSLPDFSGHEATKLLKSDPGTQSIPIIILTAHAMDSDRDDALHAGCDDFDTKPIELSRLLDKITTLLDRPVPDLTTKVK
jgi:CheY-like chemotaxis protein